MRAPKDSDAKLVKDRDNLKISERTRNDIERYQFESSIGFNKPEIRFDYSDNVFSYRGDWKTKIKVIKLFLPFIVNKKKCEKFEELVNKAFETIFLET